MLRGMLFPINLALVLAIGYADRLAPDGSGIIALAALPVLLSTLGARPRQVWITGTAAIATLVFATVAEPGFPAIPRSWMLSRGVTLVVLAVSTLMALHLQGRRIEAVQARDEALSTSELNRLMRSLLAHDLRAPLAVSNQALEYVEDALAEGRSIDRDLLADVRARLRRSLRAIDIVLDLARTQAPVARGSTAAALAGTVNVRDEITAEIASFASEANSRGKQIVAELDSLGADQHLLDGSVLRQTLAILLDNAIRYAVPGPIRVAANVAESGLVLSVEDSGPGLSATLDSNHPSNGTGLGLTLSRSLVARAGGRLSVERDTPDGTHFVLHLPIRCTPAAEPEPATISKPVPPAMGYTTG